MWTIFKGFIEFVRILLLFYVFLSWRLGLWDLNSPTGDQTHTPCMGRCGLNHWVTREVPSQPFLILSFLIYKMGTGIVSASCGPCEGEGGRCAYSALDTMSSQPMGIINIITVVIISRLSICYNPNSWRTVQGNKSLVFVLFCFFLWGLLGLHPHGAQKPQGEEKREQS